MRDKQNPTRPDGGVPSTSDSTLSPSMSGSSDLSSDGSMDRERPAMDKGSRDTQPKPADADKGKTPQRQAEAKDEGPLESLGKAVSAPVLGAADEDADEKPR
jgi:hypothetical protein